MAYTGNNRILKISSDRRITVTGKEGSPFGEFNNPSEVAVDSKDNLYVTDTANQRIQKISSDGNVTSIGKNGSALGKFIVPYGVAIDSKDNSYVTDIYNHRIQQFILTQHLGC